MTRAGDSGKRTSRKHKRSPVGASPGTLVADPSAPQSALTLTLVSPEGEQVIDNAQPSDVLANRGKWPVIWLDCVGLGNIGLIEEIGAVFDLHPLALEDTVNTGQRAKVDFFDDHAFVVLRSMDEKAAHRFEQISIFFGEDFVVTFQEFDGDPFDPVRKRIRSSTPNRLRTRKADYLAYALIDAIVDSYFHPVEQNGDRIDRTEDEMLSAPEKHQMHELHGLRRSATVLKQALWPLRDALAGLVRSEASFVSPGTKIFINDALDHAIRLIEIVETQRDTLTGLIDLQLSLTQARTNDVIGLLTIVSVIFIPLTFLAGIWGMNFDSGASPWNMPELHAYFGYPIALGVMVAMALAMVAFFRWKKWL